MAPNSPSLRRRLARTCRRSALNRRSAKRLKEDQQRQSALGGRTALQGREKKSWKKPFLAPQARAQRGARSALGGRTALQGREK